MAYLYSHSKTWRRIVDATSRSRTTMLVFAAGCVAVPWFLGDQVMQQTNSQAAKAETDLEKKLRSRSGMHAQVLAQAQKERLQVMLDEIKDRSKSSDERYKAALDGRSLGTHSRGTTLDARAIEQQQAAAAAAGVAPDSGGGARKK